MKNKRFEKKHLSTSEKIAGIGGIALIGSIITAEIAIIGETIDRILPQADAFPGGTLGKVAGGLASAALGLMFISEVTNKDN